MSSEMQNSNFSLLNVVTIWSYWQYYCGLSFQTICCWLFADIFCVHLYQRPLGSVICFLYNLGWVKLISDFIGRSKIKIYIDSNDYLVYINNQPSSTGGHFNHMILNGAVKSLYLTTRLLDFLVFSCPFINFLQNLIDSPTVTLLKPNLLSS